jgi:hypothetical protein
MRRLIYSIAGTVLFLGKHPGNPSTGSDLGLGIWANGTADPTQEKNP